MAIKFVFLKRTKVLIRHDNMRKNYLIAVAFVLLFSSCQFLDYQVPDKELMLKEELKSINWNEVDEFPSVSDCDNITDEAQQRQCFFEFLTQTIQQKLSGETLSVLYPQLDTIEGKVTVFPDSTIRFEPHFPKDSIAYDTIKIDSILHARLVDFPKIHPALKRGTPVKTQFILPVILKMEH